MALRKRRAGLVYPTGEDWHYVGSGGGEPAFQNGWANVASILKLAFRMRETGIVDIQGYIRNTTPLNTDNVIFTLPTRYVPTGKAFIIATGDDTSGNRHPERLDIYTTSTAGDVIATTNVYQDLYIQGQFFLSPPT